MYITIHNYFFGSRVLLYSFILGWGSGTHKSWWVSNVRMEDPFRPKISQAAPHWVRTIFCSLINWLAIFAQIGDILGLQTVLIDWFEILVKIQLCARSYEQIYGPFVPIHLLFRPKCVFLALRQTLDGQCAVTEWLEENFFWKLRKPS